MEKFESIIRKEQLVQLQTLKKLDEICRKNGIKYWMGFGSLIGTIRHQGFIPWDDDLDIGIMRSDYKKLAEIPKEEWGDDLMLCLPCSDDERHDKTFARIYIKNSRVQSKKDIDNWRRWSDDMPWSTSLMCDLLIFDNVPEKHEEFIRIHRQFDRLKWLYKTTKLKPYTSSRKFEKKLETFIKRICSRVFRLLWKKPWVVIDRINEKLALKHQGSYIGSYYVTDCNEKRGASAFPADFFFPLKEAKFEGVNVYIPNKYDEMLTALYGNYMTPPPESKRHHLCPVFLDLGDGNEHVFSTVPGSLGDH